MARVFALRGQVCFGDGVIAVQGCVGPVVTHGTGFKSKPAEQRWPLKMLENASSLLTRILTESICGYPGTRFSVIFLTAGANPQKL